LRQVRVSRDERRRVSIKRCCGYRCRVTREFHGTYFICSPGPPAAPRYILPGMTAEQIDPNRARGISRREIREGNLFPPVILLAAANCAGNCAAMQISPRAGESQASFRIPILLLSCEPRSRLLASRAAEPRAEARKGEEKHEEESAEQCRNSVATMTRVASRTRALTREKCARTWNATPPKLFIFLAFKGIIKGGSAAAEGRPTARRAAERERERETGGAPGDDPGKQTERSRGSQRRCRIPATNGITSRRAHPPCLLLQSSCCLAPPSTLFATLERRSPSGPHERPRDRGRSALARHRDDGQPDRRCRSPREIGFGNRTMARATNSRGSHVKVESLRGAARPHVTADR